MKINIQLLDFFPDTVSFFFWERYRWIFVGCSSVALVLVAALATSSYK